MKIYLYFVILILLVGCTSGSSSSFDINDKFINKWFYFCGEKGLEEYIHNSDFCVIGKALVKKQHEYTEGLGANVVEGEIEINSVVYGHPETKSITFSTLVHAHRLSSGFPSGIDTPGFLWGNGSVENGTIYLILGKGKGKDATVLKADRPMALKFINSTIECFQTIKEMERLVDKEMKQQQEKLLKESQNIELLCYLFRKSIKEFRMEGAVSTVETIFSKGKITQERKFISFLLVDHIFYPPGCIRMAGSDEYSPPREEYAHYRDITSAQAQRLKDIIINSFVDIKTIDKAIRYTDILGMNFLKHDEEFRKSLKKVIGELSKYFEKEKDYPEWEKWVKKIFPDETSKPNEDKPDEKGK